MIGALIVVVSLFLFHLIPFIATGMIAHKKKRNWLVWLLPALFFPIITLIIVAIAAPLVPCKRCAQCRRLSWATAIACPYCNSPLSAGPVELAPDPAAGNRTIIGLIVAVVVFVGGIMVIGIIAAIAIPQFANLVAKSQEGATKANLGVLRSGIAIYYGEHNGVYPGDLNTLMIGKKYIQQIPAVNLPRTTHNVGHPSLSTITYGALKDGAGLTDTGGWFYDNTHGPDAGRIVVNCSHSDSHGKRWDTY